MIEKEMAAKSAVVTAFASPGCPGLSFKPADRLFTLLRQPGVMGTADVEIKAPSAENPEPSKPVSFKPRMA